MKPPASLVWGTATLMVTIVSCCSLIGVSIMPLISGPSYKIFITLFTGLAVGSLLGSAIFSLIPQAFSLHLQKDKSYLWKSLIIFFGIYLFYFSERLMRIYFNRKAKQQNLKYEQERQASLKKNKSSNSLPDAQAETSDEGGDNSTRSNNVRLANDNVLMTEISLAKDGEGTGDQENESGRSTNLTQHQQLHHHHSHALNPQDNLTQHQQLHHHHSHALNPQEVLTKVLKREESIRRNNVPVRRSEIAPVAWMIIIGDGLHNFIDGLSIGAAFSESLVLGVSTSVAVIFEEFPHELGDFAVLISSGMSVKQALCFNFLSACTCYIGMILGILLGDLTQSASFIFALAGGMFLYISLVDMMGELSIMLEESKQSTREVSRLLMMQNIGILSGIIITFTLSLFSNG